MQKRSKAPLFVLACIGLAIVAFMRCASTNVAVYSYESKLLAEADSLFRGGSYEYAKLKYTKVRDDYPSSPAGAKAQYLLGYINIYYDNPFADYNAALREFKRFTAHYPEDDKVEMVNNWIRLLTLLQDFSTNYHGNTSQLRELKSKQKSIFRNYGTLQEAYLRCDAQKDSLAQRIRILEGIIAELDKIR